MNKRKFFSTLGSIALGCYLGVGKELLEFKDELKDKVISEWKNADYEVYFILGVGAYEELKIGPPPKRVKYEAGMFTEIFKKNNL